MRIGFDLKIELNGGCHIGTGLARGLIHRTTQRNARGDVYIPGSTLKGRLRDSCEHVARLYRKEDNRLRVCEPPNPSNMCRGKEPCIICSIFGSPYVQGRLFFSDAMIQPELVKVYGPADQVQSRTRVQLDRRKGIAAKGHLFSTEYVEPHLVFATRVSGTLPMTLLPGESIYSYELILLGVGIRLLKNFGGDKSAGFGGCQVSFSGDITLGNKESQMKVSSDQMIELIVTWLEWLEFYRME
jgi:CRISPR/Cas system CSM-associated protein Csm3 (group 7 of RAMP superfamily)